MEGCVHGGGTNDVCLAHNSVVSGGGNNTILEAEVDGGQLQVGKQSDQTHNVFKRKPQKASYRHHLLQATHWTADGIRTLIVKKEAILKEQQDTLPELEQELDELFEKEEQGGSGEVEMHLFHASYKLAVKMLP